MKEFIEFMDTKDGEKARYHLDEAIKIIRKIELDEEWRTIEFRNQFVKYLMTALVTFEEIDDYPYIHIYCKYEPPANDFDLRLRSLGLAMRDAQSLYNHFDNGNPINKNDIS